VDASSPSTTIEDLLGVELGDFLPYDTLAGLILDRLGRIPEKGENIEWQDFLLTCEEVTKTAILKVKIARIEKPADGQTKTTPMMVRLLLPSQAWIEGVADPSPSRL